jgi:hypothetical protein
MVVCQVTRDPVEPRFERAPEIILVQVEVCPYECFLRDIARILDIANQLAQHKHETVGMSGDDLFICRLLPG